MDAVLLIVIGLIMCALGSSWGHRHGGGPRHRHAGEDRLHAHDPRTGAYIALASDGTPLVRSYWHEHGGWWHEHCHETSHIHERGRTIPVIDVEVVGSERSSTRGRR
jgi:hypothetical protein